LVCYDKTTNTAIVLISSQYACTTSDLKLELWLLVTLMMSIFFALVISGVSFYIVTPMMSIAYLWLLVAPIVSIAIAYLWLLVTPMVSIALLFRWQYLLPSLILVRILKN